MIYGKLPVTFLSAIASEKNGSTNSAIAAFILEHLDEVKGMNITELAEVCHVSASTISRFCKETGFDSYAELREILETAQLTTETLREDPFDGIIQSLEMVKRSLDMRKVRQLCKEISKYKRVAAFGLLKAEAAAVDLQCDLLMQGKQIFTNVSYPQQMEYVLSAGPEDLILIFSYTGAYFEYQDLRGLTEKLKAPRIWMIAGEKKEYPSFINETILFESAHSQIGHPYQLQAVASVIAQEYNKV